MEDKLKQFYMKIGAAKERLKAKLRSHTDACPAEDMTGHGARCRCGADEYNAGLHEAMSVLGEA